MFGLPSLSKRWILIIIKIIKILIIRSLTLPSDMRTVVVRDIMTTNTKFCLSFLFHQLTRSSDPGVNLTLAHDIQLLITFIGFPGKFKDTSFFIALNCAGTGGGFVMNNNILFQETLFHDSTQND